MKLLKPHSKLQLINHAAKRSDIILKTLPELTEEEQKKFDEHLALYGVVGPAAAFEGSAWKHKVENFDYSIGPGLNFIKEKTGAKTALFINAVDLRSTGGRATLMVTAAIFGVGIPMGGSAVYLSMVDLETGDIMWTSKVVSPGSFEDPKKIEGFLKKQLNDYLKNFDDNKKVAKAGK